MKKVIIIALILLTAVLVLGFVPFYRNISETLPVQILDDMNEGSCVESEMIIEGKYTFRLFGDDKFEGKIEIIAFPQTIGKDVDLKLTKSTATPLIYRSYLGSKLQSESFGYIQAEMGMKNIVIIKAADGVISEDGEGVCAILTEDSDAWAVLEGIFKEK